MERWESLFIIGIVWTNTGWLIALMANVALYSVAGLYNVPILKTIARRVTVFGLVVACFGFAAMVGSLFIP